MATREENLKKINAELELLSDEEVEKIAGGTCYEMADDSRFLNSLNGSCDRYGATNIFFSDNRTDKDIKKGWSTVGIEVTFNGSLMGSNKYYLNSQQITREQAYQHAMNVAGKQMKESDWKW